MFVVVSRWVKVMKVWLVVSLGVVDWMLRVFCVVFCVWLKWVLNNLMRVLCRVS